MLNRHPCPLPPVPMHYEHDARYPLLAPSDPSAIDFRAFYPYTPNEVKHRKRTTQSQLKILESVFKRDTKPNAALRNQLAAQLDMTARGVQVWFQNRRAKEKNRFNKLNKVTSGSAGSTAAVALSPSSTSTVGPSESNPKEEDDEADSASPPPVTPGEHSPEENSISETSPDIPPDPPVPVKRDSLSNASPSSLSSPPKLHVTTDSTNKPVFVNPWHGSPAARTAPGATFPSRPSLLDAHSQRRGSLPVNAIVTHSLQPTHGPPSIDSWDALARRRSVDTSLQRLASNPYAGIARARNGALYGSRAVAQPLSGRQHNLPHRLPYPPYPRRSLLSHQRPNHHLDMRRASMDSRALVMQSTADGLSPSLSPRPGYHPVRASLPDTSLYSTVRTYIPQIPGPLPSPNFTFGAPGLGSPTAEDDVQSPDLNSYSFPPRSRDEAGEDDDVMSAVSYETLSRFGSVASIATSESSVFSNAGYYDFTSVPGETTPNSERRDSCGSTHDRYTMNVTTGLNGTGQPAPSPTSGPAGADAYFDESSSGSNLTSDVTSDCIQPQVDKITQGASYPSPVSNASVHGSPLSHGSIVNATAVPISSSSELAFALSDSRPSQQPACHDPDHSQQRQQYEQQSLTYSKDHSPVHGHIQLAHESPFYSLSPSTDSTGVEQHQLPTPPASRQDTIANNPGGAAIQQLESHVHNLYAETQDTSGQILEYENNAQGTQVVQEAIGPLEGYAPQYVGLIESFGLGVGGGNSTGIGMVGDGYRMNVNVPPPSTFGTEVGLGVPAIGIDQQGFELGYES